MSLIIELIGPELFELSALELKKNAIFDYVYTVASANIDQSVPNLATVYMPIRSCMSLIIGQIEPGHPQLFALEFGKIAESDFVLALASTNIDRNLVKTDQNCQLFALEFAKIAESDFVYTLAFTNVVQLVTIMVTIYMTMSF